MTEADVARIRDPRLDVLERNLVAGVVDDLARDRHPGAEADHRQVLLQETCPARHVRAGEFGAVERFVVIGAAQVADIVKQARKEAYGGACSPEAPLLLLLPLVADDQPRQCQSYVERVL